MAKINFVTFCCYDPSVFGGYNGTNLPRDIEIIQYLHQSIKKHHPGSSLTIATNAASDVQGRIKGAVIRDLDINTDELMYERTKFYVEYMNDDRNACDLVVFLDSDCLIVDRLDGLAAQDFDVGFTCIKEGYPMQPRVDELGLLVSDKPMASPINGGVVFSKMTPIARATWCSILETYDTLDAMGASFTKGREHLLLNGGATIKKWGGDQFALMARFGKYLIPDFPDQAVVDGAKILFLDRWEYNAAPLIKGSEIQFHADISPKIIHMKGSMRKTLIPAVAQHFGVV